VVTTRRPSSQPPGPGGYLLATTATTSRRKHERDLREPEGVAPVTGVPGTRRLDRALRNLTKRPTGALEAAGAAAGSKTQHQAWVGERIGTTPPPGVVMVETRGVSEVEDLRARFERALADGRKRLRRLGAKCEILWRRLEVLQRRCGEPVVFDGPPGAHSSRGDSRRIALFSWFFLGGLCAASAGVDEAVFEVLGLSTIATWGIALAVGTAQVIAMFAAGGRIRDMDRDRGRMGMTMLAIEVGGALAVGITAGILRAGRVSSVAALIHLPAPSFWVALSCFVAFALMVDAAAFALGYRLAGQDIRAQLVASRETGILSRSIRRADRRFEITRGRFLAAAEQVAGQLEVSFDLVNRALSDHEGALAAYYDEACMVGDAVPGADLAVQHAGHVGLVDAARLAWSQRVSEARGDLANLVAAYEPKPGATKLHAVNDGTGSGESSEDAA
jgi:hypothetical protein